MAEAKDDQEPSMEEILASIRRIISDDTPAAEAAPAPEAELAEHQESVLELTEIVIDEPEAPAAPAPLPIEPPAPIEEAIEEPPYRMPILTHDDAEERTEMPLVSQETAVASMASFASVAAEARRRLVRDQPIGNGEATLETIVNELLRPMLKDWLDTYLPDLVARLVSEEIERLSQRSR